MKILPLESLKLLPIDSDNISQSEAQTMVKLHTISQLAITLMITTCIILFIIALVIFITKRKVSPIFWIACISSISFLLAPVLFVGSFNFKTDLSIEKIEMNQDKGKIIFKSNEHLYSSTFSKETIEQLSTCKNITAQRNSSKYFEYIVLGDFKLKDCTFKGNNYKEPLK